MSVDPENPVDCPLYYAWARDELRRIDVDKLPTEQEYVNLRFPKANRLTRASDLSEDIRRANELSKIGEAFNMKVAMEKPGLGTEDRLTFVQDVEKGVTGRGAAFVDALAEPPRDHWIEPANGTLAWHLRATTNWLRTGKIEKGEAELEKARLLLDSGTTLEKSDYWFLAGRVNAMQQDDAGARDCYLQAARLNDQPKFWSGWAEAELRIRYEIDGENNFDDVIAQLQGSDPLILAVKARLLGAAGQFEAAISLLDSFEGPQSLGARAIVESMHGHPEKSLEACARGLQEPDLLPPLRQLFCS
ncbi:hypothetical protein LP415_03600 [Polaromonas sp. P1(28)-8]|nr:hypothetical protein LP415_03600 [Polaromonas sp. P1(28)-8]